MRPKLWSCLMAGKSRAQIRANVIKNFRRRYGDDLSGRWGEVAAAVEWAINNRHRRYAAAQRRNRPELSVPFESDRRKH